MRSQCREQFKILPLTLEMYDFELGQWCILLRDHDFCFGKIANEECLSNSTMCLIVLLYTALHVVIKQATATLTFKGAARTTLNNSLLNCSSLCDEGQTERGPRLMLFQSDLMNTLLVFIPLTEMPSSNDHLRGSHILPSNDVFKFIVGLFGRRWWRVPLSVSGCEAKAHSHSFSEA